MDEKDLDKVYQELLGELNKEIQIEKEIVNSSSEIAANLILNGRCKAIIDETEYQIGYRLLNSKKKIKGKMVPIKIITVLAADIVTHKIAGKRYTPFFCNCEVDESYTLNENLKAVVEAFIRHKTGRFKPEMLE